MTIEQTLARAVEKHQAGQLAEAETLYREVLWQQPHHPDALHLLGLIFSRAGQPAQAADLIQRAIRINPNAVDYWINLGTVVDALGNSAGAIEAYQKAIALRPDSAEAHNNLANALAALNRMEDAVKELDCALALRPDYADAWYNLGNIHHQLCRYEKAVECLTRATKIRPAFAPAFNNLGRVLSDLSRFDEAIGAYRRALELCPSEAGVYINLGAAYHSKGEMDLALECFETALRLSPNSVSALNNLGNVMKDSGRIEQAVKYYQRAVELDPNSVALDNNRVYSLTMHPEFDGPSILQELRIWERRHALGLENSTRLSVNDRDSDRRLRIGYVSADFRDHVVGRNILPLFRDRNRDGFEVICYSSVGKPDQMTVRYQGLCDGWRDIQAVGDESAAELVRSDGIDILADLSVHTGGNRLLLFARKPAPVQVTFAGYPGSTGLRAVDWRLTDPYLDPRDGQSDGQYVERSYRLPQSFWCYDPEAMQWEPDGVEEPPAIGSLPAEQNGVVTFGCLNNHAKVNDAVLHLWGRAMASVANSNLMQTVPYGWSRRRVTEILGQYGISPERIHFVTYKPRREYLADFGRIDIGLDTFPYNGHTGSLDAYWMGVPVISRVGRTAVGRAGLSQLSNLGLRELVAESDEQFIAIARELSGNLRRLAELRKTLRARMLASPLCDGPGFAGGIEKAFRDMWRHWCEARHS